jgi:hypothetical protein
MDPAAEHTVLIRVVNDHGMVLFQQREEIPAMTASAWCIRKTSNQLDVLNVPPKNTITCAVDGFPERVMASDSPSIGLEYDVPHTVTLRKYFGDAAAGDNVGELVLQLPIFIDPSDVQMTTATLRSPERSLDAKVEELALQRSRCRSVIYQFLLDGIISFLKSADATPRGLSTTAETLEYDSRRSHRPSSVFFRLRGEEERPHS